MYHICRRNNCVINRAAVKPNEISAEVLSIKYQVLYGRSPSIVSKELKDFEDIL